MRLRSFLLGLALVGFVASMYAAPKTILVSLMYKDSTSPYNTGWNGLSDLAELLQKKGFKVTVANSLSDLRAISRIEYDRIIYVIVSPSRSISSYETDYLDNLMRQASLSLLVADENITSNTLLRRYGLVVTGEALFDPTERIDDTPSPYPEAIMVFPTKPPGANGVRSLLEEGIEWKPYTYRLNWASRLRLTTGEFSFTGLLPMLANDFIIFSWTDNVVNDKGRAYSHVVIAVYSDGSINPAIGIDDSIIAISDGSIFLNSALRLQDTRYNYTEMVLNIFYMLSRDTPRNNVLVVIDNMHAKTNTILPRTPAKNPQDIARELGKLGVSLPIVLHPAMFAYLILWIINSLEQYYFKLLARFPLIGFPVFIIAFYLIRRYLSRQIPGKHIDDTMHTSIEEIEVVAETSVKTRYARLKKLGKREALESIRDLYLTMDIILKKNTGIGLGEALHRENIEYLSKRTGIPATEIMEFLSSLTRLYERAIGKRRFTPIVFNWDKTTRKLIYSAEKILESLGYTLVEKEKLKGAEYGVR